MSGEADYDYCERCGGAAQGRYRVMYYHGPLKPVAREFYCFHCLRVMRLFAVVGFSLIGVVVLGLVVATWVLVNR